MAATTPAAGGAGATAGMVHTGSSGKEAELADFSSKIRPAVEAYYAAHADLMKDSATQDEVIRCATVAINVIQKRGLEIPTVYKRKGLPHYTNGESIPRSMILSENGEAWRVDVFGQKVIGRGGHKKVKSIVSIEYSLVRHDVTISNDVVCIHNGDISSIDGFSPSKQKRLLERAPMEVKNHIRLKASSVFMSLKSSTQYTSKDGMPYKFYTTHPKATLGDLTGFAFSTDSIPGSADRLKISCQAFASGAKALAELHKKELVYCDFKPQNLLGFAEDGSWRLGDLESIISVDKYKKERHSIITSPLFIPPECVDYLIRYSSKVAPEDPKMHDVWSLGISFLIMIFILNSHKEDSELELFSILGNTSKKIETIEELARLLSSLKQERLDFAITTAISKDSRLAPFEPLLKNMLKINPRDRIPMARVSEEWVAIVSSMPDAPHVVAGSGT